jgi:ribosomal protein L11 methyltransferase
MSEIGNSLSWLLVTIDVTPDAEEAASVLLFDRGSNGIVTLTECEDYVRLAAYFDSRTDIDDVKLALEAAFDRMGNRDALREFAVCQVPDQDWMQKWKEGFEAVEVGKRLIVAPSWKLPEDARGRIVIQIDPGMAFGTGTHETTRLCLEAIERYWRGNSLLDVGTGTGILAIAAAMLVPGSKIVGIDVDPQAIEVARENASINNVSHLVELREAQPSQLAGRDFDVVIANLTAEVIVDLIPELVACLATNGLMILSGILSELAEEVQRSLRASGLEVTERRDASEWSALIARR